VKKIIFAAICSALSLHCFAGPTPVFSVTPLIAGQSTLITGETGSAVYQVTNNAKYTLTNISMTRMPAGVTANTSSVSVNAQYCTSPFSLASGSSCLLKVNLDSSQFDATLSGGPIVCFNSAKPFYCSQPLNPGQLFISVSKGPIPQDCNSNVANFNFELLQNFDSTTGFTVGWGPDRLVPGLRPANPDLRNCAASAGVSWQQQRIIAAAIFWVAQKLNYCHHYNPDYATPLSQRNAGQTAGGFCNPALDAMPGSVYYGQLARWNYSGKGSETSNNWVNNNQMWYGMDCSNTTAFIYGFALGTNATLGIPFDSKTGYQAGQINGTSQDTLSPNEQVNGDPARTLNNPNAAGLLVCADGSTDPNPSAPSMCAGHGGYLSGISNTGCFTKSVTVAQVAAVLQPGDLPYIAGASGRFCGSPDRQPRPDAETSDVTHVIMWLGKQVGYGANDINPALIAPADVPCADPSIWLPKIGDWVIVDSHYQGYDYRVLTTCFYLNDLWGVRRVIRAV
jgi:hypothetical protein